MQFEESVSISAGVEKVFSLYANVADWAAWDPDVKEQDQARLAPYSSGFEAGG